MLQSLVLGTPNVSELLVLQEKNRDFFNPQLCSFFACGNNPVDALLYH